MKILKDVSWSITTHKLCGKWSVLSFRWRSRNNGLLLR